MRFFFFFFFFFFHLRNNNIFLHVLSYLPFGTLPVIIHNIILFMDNKGTFIHSVDLLSFFFAMETSFGISCLLLRAF